MGGMKYIAVVLYPMVVCLAVYSLMNHSYKSWWSWLISSLADASYTFGFINMFPQIFINYKLKSVAHMPWRVMMYKAFNTFVDDAVAWGGIFPMPFKHRLMTLRDDLVFLIFLYQLYIYKVDTSRADEYGFVHAMDEKAAVDGKEKQTEARQQAIEAQVAQMLEDSDSDEDDEDESTVKEAEGSAGEVAVAEPAKAEVAVDADLGATEQAFEWVPPMVALQRRKDRFRQ